MATHSASLQDPKEKHPKPPFPEQQQDTPGAEAMLTPKADHGEESYKGCGKLEGRKALITGGDSGIGRAVAIAYAREGADVLISYLPEEEEDAQETRQQIEQAGRKAVLVPGSIAEEDHCKALVQRCVDELGGLDILVNNAAYQMTHNSLQEWSSDEIMHTFKVNIIAMF